jgi:putative zinc finger protein
MMHPTNENLTDYLYHALSAEDDARIHTHLETCAVCRADYQREARLTEILRAHARRQERDLPAGVIARIWDKINAETARPRFWETARALFRPAVGIPIAAAIALAAYFGPAYWNARNAPPSIDAMYYLQDHATMNDTLPFADSAAMPASLQNDVAMAADASR